MPDDATVPLSAFGRGWSRSDRVRGPGSRVRVVRQPCFPPPAPLPQGERAEKSLHRLIKAPAQTCTKTSVTGTIITANSEK